MSELFYPTLDLFLYDLRNGLGETEAEIQQNRDQFKKKLPEKVHPFLFQFDAVFDAEYLELLPKPHFEPFAQKDDIAIDGYYYPVRLNDTYGLLLDSSMDNQTEAQPTQRFTLLKQQLEQRLHGESATVGQTWMMSGWLSPGETHPEGVAQDCYASLCPNRNWEEDLQGQGSFLGATIYELWQHSLTEKQSTQPKPIQAFQNNQHIIIILYPNHAIATEEAPRFYADWLQLFHYRHKILWAYGQSRWLTKTLKGYLSEVQTVMKSLSQAPNQRININQASRVLNLIQDVLTSATDHLISLDFQSRTIEINISNYQKRLQRIIQKADTESQLDFLEEFSQLAENKYLLQITKDYENLTLAFRLLDSSINTLRSRVEVDQAKRDRVFQSTVAIVGVGLGVASVIESSGDFCNETTLQNQSAICAVPLADSIGIGLIAAFLTWLVIRLCP